MVNFLKTITVAAGNLVYLQKSGNRHLRYLTILIGKHFLTLKLKFLTVI